MKKVYCLGIGGIGVSALARYYLANDYQVYGNDKSSSILIDELKKEGMMISIGDISQNDLEMLNTGFEGIIYSEAIPKQHIVLETARKINIPVLSYPEALGEITKSYRLISIAGTHGKSTTTSLISLIFHKSSLNFTSIVGTLIKEFGGKNFFSRQNTTTPYFVLESCEYKESFLNYHPFIGVITNIEADHLDYYKNEQNYIAAFKKFVDNIIPGGYLIINRETSLSKSLAISRKDIHIIEVYNDTYTEKGVKKIFPDMKMQIPGEHILFDAKLAYICAKIAEIEEREISESLQNYTGIWRRMETIGITVNGNVLMSDYGHHPTEIFLTTKAIKEQNPDIKLFCIFQPHQYNRTIELFDEFITCFGYCDTILVPNIYASRDTKEDIESMPPQKFVDALDHQHKIFGNGLKNSLDIIQDYDSKYPNSSIFLLQGAGDIDNLRYEIPMK